MPNVSTAVDIVSDVGTGAVVLLLLSQLPAYYDAIRVRQSTAHLSLLPTLGQFANFVLWSAYGVSQGDLAVLRVNLVG